MGIEKLKGSLISEASEDAKKIVDGAEAEVKGLLEEERARKASLKKEAEKDVARALEEQRNERIAWARLESKRLLSEAKEDAIKGVLEDFFESLGSVRKAPEYKKFLNSSVAAAVAELGAGSVVRVAKGDKALLSSLKGTKVSEDLEGLGGAMVESADGKIRIDLTLETQYESRKDDIRKQIYEKLFGGR
jgi:V/A-type H+/Na+-transporting ATPase subunit E